MMKPIDRQILRLAIPSILANITVPLVGMADIAVAGHLASESAALIGGITIGSMLFDLLYWNFAFLRAGTGGMTAQAYGRGDMGYAADTLSRALGISLVAAVLLLLSQWLVVSVVFLFVDCSPEVRELAESYFFIRIWAAPATLSLMAFKGWFIGMQDTVSPMAADIIVNVTNVAMSIALSFGFGPFPALGFTGVAWGTVTAQYIGLLFSLAVVAIKYKGVFRGYGLSRIVASFRGPDIKSFFKTNADLFVRSVCFIAVYIGYTIISARYGDLLLASSSIIMKLMLFFSYFTDGFAYAGEALTGKYTGRRDISSVRLTVRHTFIWSMGIGMLFILINALVSVPLFRLMTSDAAVVDVSGNFIIWLVLVPLFGCPAFTWDGIYLGATATRAIRNSSLWSVAAFFAVWLGGIALTGLPFSSTETLVPAIHLLLMAYLAHLAARTISLSITYRSAIMVPLSK